MTSITALVDGYMLNCRCEGKWQARTKSYQSRLRCFGHRWVYLLAKATASESGACQGKCCASSGNALGTLYYGSWVEQAYCAAHMGAME